tara:strand:- start:77 stop:589 length:513 start_codon:yes stop_codon:yes gene_type:complete
MTKDWLKEYQALPSEELDKIAVLRVMECTNGIIQYAHRDDADYKLSIEETRKAMNFSMGSIKRMKIELTDETITFNPETEVLMREARELYISGAKKGNDEDFAEFMAVSAATAKACGLERLVQAVKTLKEKQTEIPSRCIVWGLEYLLQFFDDEHIRDFFQSKGFSDAFA